MSEANQFKSRVALDALREAKSIQQIAQKNDIAPSQVSAWKKELEERISELFERKNAVSDAAKKSEIQSARLERKVGQLVIEKEFLEKNALYVFYFSPTSHLTVLNADFGTGSIYCQVNNSGLFAMTRWDDSGQLASAFTKPDLSKQLIIVNKHVYRRRLDGMHKNEDVFLSTA